MIETKGKQFGIRLVPRSKNDNHICLQILTEDDGIWHERGEPFSSHWLEDLLTELHITEVLLHDQQIDDFGYKFKEHPDEIIS